MEVETDEEKPAKDEKQKGNDKDEATKQGQGGGEVNDKDEATKQGQGGGELGKEGEGTEEDHIYDKVEEEVMPTTSTGKTDLAKHGSVTVNLKNNGKHETSFVSTTIKTSYDLNNPKLGFSAGDYGTRVLPATPNDRKGKGKGVGNVQKGKSSSLVVKKKAPAPPPHERMSS